MIRRSIHRAVAILALTAIAATSTSEEPLRMGSIAGETVIYSVGPDGRDDKAQVEWNLLPSSPGDFIFRLDILKVPKPQF